MMGSFNRLLLAISHSFNLIIYCLSSKSFRKSICSGIYRSRQEERHDGRSEERLQIFEEQMRNMRTTLSMIQQSLESKKRSRFTNHTKNESLGCQSTSKPNKYDINQSKQNDVLPYLDLAVVASKWHDNNIVTIDSNISKSCFILNL